MENKRLVQNWLKGTLFFFAMLGILPPVHAAATDPGRLPHFDRMRREAERFEQDGEWAKACAHYDRLLSQDRNQPEIRERYQHCLRCAQLVRRHQDTSYRALLGNLSLEDSLKVYGEVLTRLQTFYADRDKVELPLLFGQGVQELHFLLDNHMFRQEYLASIQRDRVRSFQRELQTNWARRPIRRLDDAKTQSRTLAEAAFEILGVRPSLVILEMSCGACAGLDEYTHFVTPAQFVELNASWKGDFASVGLEVTMLNEGLAIAEIIPGTAAELVGLKAGDHIARIGAKSALGLSVEAATELLKGEVGTTVEVEVISPGDRRPRIVQLRRRYVHVPSLSEPRFLDQPMGVGYLQLVTFQESTVQELDEAILKLQEAGMRTLILDLRTNQGGLFEVAVQVVERFVSAGIIVSTHGQVREYNNTYRARGSSVLTVPLVVLIDGATASSAEMVAGAIKDHERGSLVGRTTFGKGSIQRLQGLSTAPGGIRMTVATFYSPHGLPYSGRGVTPHCIVEPADMPMDLEQDAQVQRALEIARSLAMSR